MSFAPTTPRPASRLLIEVWADVVCPFCWIGKRHLEEALRRLGLEDEVEVRHRAFELNPGLARSRPLREYLAERFGGDAGSMTRHVAAMGAPQGLAFDFGRAVAAPTFDAHRLVLHAQEKGLGQSVMERLMRAHFQEAADLADHATLRALAVEAGLAGDEVDALLPSDRLAAQVRADEAEARQAGVRGVPFFVLDGRYALGGAQPVETFVRALSRVQAERAGDAPDAA